MTPRDDLRDRKSLTRRVRHLGRLFEPSPEHVRHRLRVWPYTWASLGWFAAAFVLMTAAWTAAGFAVVEWFEPSSIGRAEADLNIWLEENRTEGLNRIADLLSIPSDTPVKIVMMIAAAIAFPLVFRRWHDWAFLLGALLLEVAVYGAASFLVGRPRPPVERLSSAPTESFPSGHMAAAVTFYVGLALIVRWHTTSRAWRLVAWTVGALIPIGMFGSRLYLGMHYVSDMIGGIALGATALVVALNIADDGLDRTKEQIDDDGETIASGLDDLDVSQPGPPTSQRR